VSDDVLSSFKRELAGWTEGGGTACERNYTRGEAFLAVDACGSSLRLTARALPRVEIPPPPPLPPRPYGAQYPVSEGYGKTPEPASYEVEAGETCERISSSDVPSIVIPPPPGIRAEFSDEPLHGFESQVLVEWSFDRILGDCPPVEVNLTLPNPTRGMSPLSLPFDVRARSGTARLPVLDSFRNSYVLWATAESVDGTRSRTVSVFIRRPR
jgi:hypothetical protein